MNLLIILIKLIAAHLVGDFIFQPDKMCKNKVSSNNAVRFTWVCFHSFIQAAFTYLFLADWSNWQIPLIVGCTHFLIDALKSFSPDKGFVTFIGDQIAHFLALFLIWWLFYVIGDFNAPANQYILSFKTWVIFTCFVAILSPTAIFIKLFLSYERWTPEDIEYKGLPNAGKWIGYLERILILIFIYTGNIEGIGFLLAAKSIFRFGELNKSRDLKITEYVLIGTFLSFTIAIILGYGSNWIISLQYK